MNYQVTFICSNTCDVRKVQIQVVITQNPVCPTRCEILNRTLSFICQHSEQYQNISNIYSMLSRPLKTVFPNETLRKILLFHFGA